MLHVNYRYYWCSASGSAIVSCPAQGRQHKCTATTVGIPATRTPSTTPKAPITNTTPKAGFSDTTYNTLVSSPTEDTRPTTGTDGMTSGKLYDSVLQCIHQE